MNYLLADGSFRTGPTEADLLIIVSRNGAVPRSVPAVPTSCLVFTSGAPFIAPDGSWQPAGTKILTGPLNPDGSMFAGIPAGSVRWMSAAEFDANYQAPSNAQPALSTSTPAQITAYAASFSDPSAKATALLGIACSLAALLNQSPGIAPASAQAAAPVTNQALGLGGTPPPPQGFGPSTIEPGFQANPTT